jgi:hypothetical protein
MDTNINRLNWSEGTKLKSSKQDFTYLELEGGGTHSWGEMYGFFDVENVGKTGADTRTAAKFELRYYLFDSPISLYGHVYNFASNGFSEQNDVVGLGYQYEKSGFIFKPFLGFHEVSQTFFSGFNGYMAGWFIAYFFQIMHQDFMLADWHEMEFARNQTYANGNGGSKTSQNGALSFWWNPSRHYSMGVQWRYCTDKLGTPGSSNAEIYTVKYIF